MPLCWPLCCGSEAILFKRFRPGHWAGVFIRGVHMGKFSSRLPRSASHMNTSIFLQRKEREARSRKPSQPGWRGSYEEALYAQKWMFKITQTDSLHDRMFELIIHAKAKARHAWVFPTSFAVILSAVALPIALKAEFNFELIMYITSFVF